MCVCKKGGGFITAAVMKRLTFKRMWCPVEGYQSRQRQKRLERSVEGRSERFTVKGFACLLNEEVSSFPEIFCFILTVIIRIKEHSQRIYNIILNHMDILNHPGYSYFWAKIWIKDDWTFFRPHQSITHNSVFSCFGSSNEFIPAFQYIIFSLSRNLLDKFSGYLSNI